MFFQFIGIILKYLTPYQSPLIERKTYSPPKLSPLFLFKQLLKMNSFFPYNDIIFDDFLNRNASFHCYIIVKYQNNGLQQQKTCIYYNSDIYS